MALLKLIPATKNYLWGGTRLIEEYGKKTDAPTLAETWELSCHPDGPSRIAETGAPLAQFLQQKPAAAGTNCTSFQAFPVLIKLIDAAKALSVQVHPNDAYAIKHEHQLGKTEMWYIVDCKPGASIYYGLARETTKQELKQAIEENTLCEKLKKVCVKKGDCFFIPAGTIHAIGAGCLIAEVQQNSNVTYRVYDYGRTDANGKQRELHIEKACDVMTTTPNATKYDFGPHLAKCDYFTVDKLNISGQPVVRKADAASFHSLLVLDGEAVIRCGENTLCAKKATASLWRQTAARIVWKDRRKYCLLIWKWKSKRRYNNR